MIVYIFQNQINNAKITLKIYVYCTCFTQKITIFYKHKTKKILKKYFYITNLNMNSCIFAQIFYFANFFANIFCLLNCLLFLFVGFIQFFTTINKNAYLYWSIYILYSIPWSYELYFIISNLWFCFDSLNNNSRKKRGILFWRLPCGFFNFNFKTKQTFCKINF